MTIHAIKFNAPGGLVGFHCEPAQHLAGLESQGPHGHRAAAVQCHMLAVLAHVHAEHDLFDAAGVIIENKFHPIAFEGLRPWSHRRWYGWRIGNRRRRGGFGNCWRGSR